MTGTNALPSARSQARQGRTPTTTHGELSHTALKLFLERGFDQTTIDDIVQAAGIGRRTFFRYFPSKNDLPWGDFDELLEKMRMRMQGIEDETPLFPALREAVLDFNRFPEAELPYHRERMWLILNVPSLTAHSMLKYASWRGVIAEFVGRRVGGSAESLAAQSIAWVCLSISLSAYEQWLADESSDLLTLIDSAFSTVKSLVDGAAS